METSTSQYFTPDPLAFQAEEEGEEYLTGEEIPSELDTTLRFLSIIIYSIAFLLGTTGNGLVIWIAGFKMKRTVNTVWFLNLAIADFIFTFFLPLSITYTALGFNWPFGTLLCKLNSTIAFLNLFASVFLLTVISADRCVSVVRPVWAQNHRTPRLASAIALSAWLAALILCSPYLAFRDTIRDNENNVTHCYNNYAFSNDFEDLEVVALRNMRHQVMISVRFLFGFLLPFGLILVFYSLMALKLRRSHISWSSRPFKVMASVVVAFFLCWFPYHILSVLEVVMHHWDNKGLKSAVLIGSPLATSLAFFNSCLNPFLYVFLGRDFKESLRRSILSAFETAFSEEQGKNAYSLANPRSLSDQESQFT
ncbi:chemokine-like receptor 1 [Rana temporaria]|uniref:chemokine-like receptor 1 n=1 Tax=Rana temporaria TaxID=8407 RepID=UPI001AAD676C|nr:chemokine-like receptor 1 [Rana temporaria]